MCKFKVPDCGLLGEIVREYRCAVELMSAAMMHRVLPLNFAGLCDSIKTVNDLEVKENLFKRGLLRSGVPIEFKRKGLCSESLPVVMLETENMVAQRSWQCWDMGLGDNTLSKWEKVVPRQIINSLILFECDYRYT